MNDISKECRKQTKRANKYEKALIAIASFGEGIRPETGGLTVDSSFDEPGSATIAREALGKKICKQFKGGKS